MKNANRRAQTVHSKNEKQRKQASTLLIEQQAEQASSVSPVDTEAAPEILHTLKMRQRHSLKYRLDLWAQQRPVAGSLLIICSGVLILWGPLAFIQFAFVPGNTIWTGILVGSVLCALGCMQLFCPTYARLTGVLAILCALASLIAASGGFGIGMILGIIGGAQGTAWCSRAISEATYQRMRDARVQRPSKIAWWKRRKQSNVSHCLSLPAIPSSKKGARS